MLEQIHEQAIQQSIDLTDRNASVREATTLNLNLSLTDVFNSASKSFFEKYHIDPAYQLVKSLLIEKWKSVLVKDLESLYTSQLGISDLEEKKEKIIDQRLKQFEADLQAGTIEQIMADIVNEDTDIRNNVVEYCLGLFTPSAKEMFKKYGKLDRDTKEICLNKAQDSWLANCLNGQFKGKTMLSLIAYFKQILLNTLYATTKNKEAYYANQDLEYQFADLPYKTEDIEEIEERRKLLLQALELITEPCQSCLYLHYGFTPEYVRQEGYIFAAKPLTFEKVADELNIRHINDTKYNETNTRGLHKYCKGVLKKFLKKIDTNGVFEEWL